MVNNLPAMVWEDPLENRMATHSSILAWRIPWTEEPGRLQSKGSQRVRHDWETNTFTFRPHSLQPGTGTWKNVEQISGSVPMGSAHPDLTCCLHSRWCDDTGPTRSSGSAGQPPAAGSHRMTSPGSSLPLQSPSAGCQSARCRAESRHHNTHGHLWWLVPGPRSAGRVTVRRKPSHTLPSDTATAVENPDGVPSCICLVGLFLCQQRIFKPQKHPLMLVSAAPKINL